MDHRSTASSRVHLFCLPFVFLLGVQACKPRVFNDSMESSTAMSARRGNEALAAALTPLWPIPKSAAEVAALPAVTSTGISTLLWQRVLAESFVDNSTGRPLTLSSPECARSVDAWRISAARLSLYEVDLPGNVTSWQTLALQRESDLAQRIQLHITVQPWCSSTRLERSDFVHTLDHAVQLTFDLSLPFLSKHNQDWLEELSAKSRSESQLVVKAENKVLPYARALLDINSSQNGRSAIVAAWNDSLQTQSLAKANRFPNAEWLSLKQSLGANRNLKIVGKGVLAHPTLQSNPAALAPFFARFISEKNLIRIRAHMTEGLGTSQHFYRWEKQAGKMARVALQTTSASWDRGANAITLSPLLMNPQLSSRVGVEQPASEANRQLLRDVDLESTPMANDIDPRELISLNEKIIDHERTSVHSTRCVSCHALDDAQTFAREGRPVAQRGITPAQLTLIGVSMDGRPVMNLRSLRAADSDAVRFEEEFHNVQQPLSGKQ